MRLVAVTSVVVFTGAAGLGHGIPARAVTAVVPPLASYEAADYGWVGYPATDGEYVLWTGRTPEDAWGCSALYAARLDDRQPMPLDTGGCLSTTPDVDEGWFVSVLAADDPDGDGRANNTTAYATNLANGERVALSNDWVLDAAITGGIAVWITALPFGPEQEYTLLRRDMRADDAPTVIASGDAFIDMYQLQADGGYAYWRDAAGRLWTADLTRDDPPRRLDITIEGIGMYDVAGDWVAILAGGRLRAQNLVTGELRWIDRTAQTGPATDGRYVYWTDAGEQAGTMLYAYDLVTDSRFVVYQSIGTPPAVIWGGEFAAAEGALVWGIREVDRYNSYVFGAPVVGLLPSAPRPAGLGDATLTYYPETGHYLGGGFRDYWQLTGGLPIFGYPLTEEYATHDPLNGTELTVQYLERQRFEWHPENHGTPYTVLLGRLGAELLVRQGRDWTTFPQADPDTPHYVPETGHAIAEQFSAYWSTHGLEFGDAGVSYRESLALFGYPLSEPMLETNADGDAVLTQYFERAVFEYHPTNPDLYAVLLRRLGAEALAAQGW
jgi:hypothetical protein